MVRSLWVALLFVLASELAPAEEFRLTVDGRGPINVHTSLLHEGKGERLIATARNDSSEVIPYVKFCVVPGRAKDCLFEMWTTTEWKPGTSLDWNMASVRHVDALDHRVVIYGDQLEEAEAVAEPRPPQVISLTPPVAPPSPVVPLPGPAPSTSGIGTDSVVKLLKAGLGDDVILTMIASQGARFTADTDSVIALKQAGASDKVISAMIGRGATPVAAPQAARQIQMGAGILTDGTPVRLRLKRNLSSASARTGETVDFEVLDEVTVAAATVIERGALAIGAVTQAESKKRLARGGKLDVTLEYVRLANGEKVAIRGSRETSGGGHTGAMTGAIVATSLVVWPAAPFFLFVHGKDTVIPQGTEIVAYVNGDVRLGR